MAFVDVKSEPTTFVDLQCAGAELGTHAGDGRTLTKVPILEAGCIWCATRSNNSAATGGLKILQ
jgi:hypothetical protein